VAALYLWVYKLFPTETNGAHKHQDGRRGVSNYVPDPQLQRQPEKWIRVDMPLLDGLAAVWRWTNGPEILGSDRRHFWSQTEMNLWLSNFAKLISAPNK
jgi:hypothetical protein